MKEHVQDIAHQIFFDVCQRKATDIDVFFLEDFKFPKISYLPIMTVYVPLPKTMQGYITYEGNLFNDLEKDGITIWSLFFASIIHAAGHAKVTDFNHYKEWMKDKNQKRAYETLEFIEDIRVENFLQKEFPEYHQEIKKIEETFKIINEKQELKNKQKKSMRVFTETFVQNVKKQRKELHDRILNLDQNDQQGFLEIANKLYDSSNILTGNTFPYRDHYAHPIHITSWNENLKLIPQGVFERNAEKLSSTWFEQLKAKAKIQKKYGGITEDLEFDNIDFAPENIGEYLRLRNATHLFLKKMSAQIKMTPNVLDEGIPEDMGLLQMQAAIQAVAAQNNSIQIFEQDDYRRIEEEWAIVMDTSSSMRLKFDEMKKFAICVGEAANEVNSKNGKWGFFAFNNNFTIIKDHYEKFDQHSKSRVGGIEIRGLSFLADAVKLCTRILERENIERRYIFLITDGQALGSQDADKKFNDAILEARKKGVSVIGIGVPQATSKIFTMAMPYEGLRKTVAKFINAYTMLASDDL